jgi:outer membrane protein assembly factor BamB
VLYVGGEVLVGYRWQPALFGLDASTGKLLVTRNVKGGINSSPSVAGGVVYFGADDNRVYAFGLK